MKIPKLLCRFFVQEHEGDYAKIASELVDYYRDYAWENNGNEELFPSSLFSSSSKNIYLKHSIAKVLIELTESFDLDVNQWRNEISLLKQLNPQAIITTNYDTLLEKIFPKYEPIVGQQVINQKKATDIGHILKIHGSVDELESIVIESDDYEKFSKKQIYLIAKLFTYFMEHPIIFIGYSLTDDNIKSILYNVKQIFDSDSEPMIPNMWFIDWSSEDIGPEEIPPKEKPISVGNGESVRLNYIKVHTYERLYEALYQDSIDIESLKQIEETVYNVVKSDSITNLEVDIASLRYLTDREKFFKSLITSAEAATSYESSLVTFAEITDPNQLALQYSLTATELSSRVFNIPNYNWYHGYALIKRVENQIGVDLRGNNNEYHVYMNGVTRFSLQTVDLLQKVLNNDPYTIIVNEKEYSYPPEE